MKKQIMKVVAAISFLFVLSAVSAFAQTPKLKANIPFDFQVNGKAMTAGEYTVAEPASPRGAVIIRGGQKTSAAVSLVRTVDASKTHNATQLVFRRYGNHYFLAQMCIKGQTAAMELPTSKAERNLVRELTGRNLANNKVEPEIVTVALAQ
ncbi:MAG: hypothetical protein AAB401_18820 [Acidobacteriota bacterium]